MDPNQQQYNQSYPMQYSNSHPDGLQQQPQQQRRKVVKQLYNDIHSNNSNIIHHHNEHTEVPTSELNDAVETILLHIESREQQQSSSSKSKSKRGKLTMNELQKLSLLATTSTSSTSSSSSNPKTKSNPQDNTLPPPSSSSSSSTTFRKIGWSTVNIDSLRELITLLEEHVRIASKVDFIKFARIAFDKIHDDDHDHGDGDTVNVGTKRERLDQWVDMTPRNNSSCYQLTSIIHQGLYAASLLISILITPYMDRTIITEDTIDATITLMKNHLQRNVIPALSNIGHMAQYSPSTTTATTTNSNTQEDNNDNSNNSSKKKKRKRTSINNDNTTTETTLPSKMSKPKQQNLIKFLKRTYKPILSQTIGQLVLLMERIDILIQSISVEDTSLNTISSAALMTVTIDPNLSEQSQSFIVQTSAIGLVTTIFRQYPKFRCGLIQDLMPLFLKLPTSKKSIRTFPVQYLTLTSVGKNKQQQQQSLNGGCMLATTPSSSSTYLASPMKQQPAGINGDQGHIQVMSALLLFLIQSCVTIPVLNQPKDKEEAEDDHQEQEEQQQSKSSLFKSTGLEKSMEVCTFFTSLLITRCAKKGDEGGASEFRPILYNLVDDLLDVQLLPDFPAAEMLLREICRFLAHDLFQSSTSKSKEMGIKRKTHVEQTYLATALETIGTICSDIAFKLVMAKDHPFEFTRAISADDLSQDVDPSKEVNGCFCGKEKSNVFSLDCDRCHRWFHGNCLRIAKDFTPTHWICDECKMITMAIKQFDLQVDEGKDLGDEERADIMRVVLLNYLSQQIRKTESMPMRDARQFHVAKFVEQSSTNMVENEESQIGNDALIPHMRYLSMWSTSDVNLKDQTILSMDSLSNEYLSEAGNTKVMISLYATKSKLVKEFRNILGVLVELMGDEDSSYLRRDAVKAISQVVRADSSLMHHKNIRDAVSRRFKDESKSVRDNAVALVGSYILQEPELAIYFHDSLLERLNDDGISVRKRAIKIFRDVIANNPSYKERTIVFAKLLQQAADRKEDDGVRDLIHETFQALWFTVRNTDETAKQMIEMLTGIPRSQHYLTSIVKEMLVISEGDKATAESKKVQIAIQRHCADIVRFLFEELIRFEEKRATSNPQPSDGPHLVSLLSTIGVYAESCPNLLLKDYHTLLPYMKADNGVTKTSEASIVYTISKIFCRLSSILSETEVQKLGNSDLPKDLMKITYEFDSKPTNAAVELLSKLASRCVSENNPFMMVLMKLAKTFYKLLVNFKEKISDFAAMKSKQKSYMQRAMAVLGSICRFHESDEDDSSLDFDETLVVVELPKLTWANLPYSSYALLEEYIVKEDTTTRCHALRAMSGIFSSHPRIMYALQEQGSLQELMCEASHPLLQLETLKCFQGILLSEESRVESGEAKRQMQSNNEITSSKKVSGDQDGDASLIGSCCAEQLTRLYEMMFSKHPEIRGNATGLIETLSRQGLLNPMEAIPPLIALQGDVKYPEIRAQSLKLLKVFVEKRPGMVRQLFTDGLKKSYFLQCTVYPEEKIPTAVLNKKDVNGKMIEECIFKDIFESAIGGSRVNSKRMIKSLLNMFFNRNQNETTKSENIPLLCYFTEILAFLPFSHLGDVLFILHLVSETITLEGNELMGNLSRFLNANGFSEVDPDATVVDCLEEAATKKNPSRTKKLACMHKDGFDIGKFASLCTKASSLSLLVRLYFHLRDSYRGVTEKRLAEYNPDEKERINDRGISKSFNLSRFDSQIPSSFSVSGKFDKDNMIRQYAIFRALMRKYDDFFNVSTGEDGAQNGLTDTAIDHKRKFYEIGNENQEESS